MFWPDIISYPTPDKQIIMKTVKLSVFAIGVALCVTPFFNSAKAQSSNDSAAILLELQTLRSEIADLRDMVERQQFELKKLKRASQVAGAASAPNNTPTYANANGVPGGNLPQAAYPNQARLPEQNGQAIDGFYGAQPRSTNTGLGSPEVSARDYANGNYTNRNPNAIDPSSSGPALVDNGVAVVERSIATARAGTQYSASGAEVVERGIDGYAGPAAAPVLSADSNYGVGSTETGSVGYNEVNNGQAGQSSRPVLSVPTGVIPQAGQTSVNAGQVSAGQQASIASQFSEDQFYDRGFDFLKQSKYDEAINVFKQQIAQYPQGELADDAHYWVAEALFINRKPAEAKPHLRAIIDNYPQSARLPDAMLKTAYIEQDLGNAIEARILLQEIVAKHPSSNAAIAAKNRLENLKGQ